MNKMIRFGINLLSNASSAKEVTDKMNEETTNQGEQITNPRVVHDLAVQIQDQILDITDNISKLQYDVDRSLLNQEAVDALTAMNNRLYAPSGLWENHSRRVFRPDDLHLPVHQVKHHPIGLKNKKPVDIHTLIDWLLRISGLTSRLIQ